MAYCPCKEMKPHWKDSTTEKVKKEIISIYTRTAHNIQNIYKIDPDKIYRAVTSMFPEWEQEIDFRKFEYAIAYSATYSVCHTDLVRIHTERFLNGDFKDKITDENKEFNILSLSGGNGDDIVGFIYGLSRKRGAPKCFKATIVEKEVNFWLMFSEEISQIFSINTIFTKYIKKCGITPKCIDDSLADCDEETWKKIEEATKEANVVIMFGVLPKMGENTQEIIERVIDWMPEGSLLLIGPKESFAIRDSCSLYKKFQTVYSSHAIASLPRYGLPFGRNILMSAKGHAEVLVKRTNPASYYPTIPTTIPPFLDMMDKAAAGPSNKENEAAAAPSNEEIEAAAAPSNEEIEAAAGPSNASFC